MQLIGDPVTQIDDRGTTHDVALLDPIPTPPAPACQRRKLA